MDKLTEAMVRLVQSIKAKPALNSRLKYYEPDDIVVVDFLSKCDDPIETLKSIRAEMKDSDKIYICDQSKNVPRKVTKQHLDKWTERAGLKLIFAVMDREGRTYARAIKVAQKESVTATYNPDGKFRLLPTLFLTQGYDQ
jgi:hypothetical protein